MATAQQRHQRTEGLNILTVGDGDFSFSSGLVNPADNVVATSYDPKQEVLTKYGAAAEVHDCES